MSRRLDPILAALVSCALLHAADFEPLPAMPTKLPLEVALRPLRVRVWDPGFEATKTRLPDGALTINGHRPYYDGPPSTLSTADARALATDWITQHLGPHALELVCQAAYPITVQTHEPTSTEQAPYTAGYLVDFRHEVHRIPLMRDGARIRIVGDDVAWCWIRLHEIDGASPPPRAYLSSKQARRRGMDALSRRLRLARTTDVSATSTELAYDPPVDRSTPARLNERVLARLTYRVRITTRGWNDRLTAWTVVVDAETGEIQSCQQQ